MRTIHKLRALATAAALITSLAPALARAADEPLDEVALQNGGMIKGTILVMEPGEKVVIRVPGEEEPRTIPWSEVSDVQRGELDEPPPVPKSEAPAEKASPEPNEPGVVRLHIDSDDPNVQLVEHKTLGTVVTPYGTVVGIESKSLCSAPCDQVIDARENKQYTIGGDGIATSEPFSLSPYEGDVTANVDAGSTALAGWGGAATTIGALSVLGGAVFLPVGLTVDKYGSGQSFRNAGIGMLAGGAAVLTAGIIMLSLSGTDVEVAPQQPPRGDTTARKARWYRGEF